MKKKLTYKDFIFQFILLGLFTLIIRTVFEKPLPQLYFSNATQPGRYGNALLFTLTTGALSCLRLILVNKIHKKYPYDK